MANLMGGVLDLDTTYAAKQALFPATLEPAPMTLEPARTAAPAPRKRRGDWAGRILDAGWAVLLLSCAGECVYRLLWAAQS